MIFQCFLYINHLYIVIARLDRQPSSWPVSNFQPRRFAKKSPWFGFPHFCEWRFFMSKPEWRLKQLTKYCNYRYFNENKRQNSEIHLDDSPSFLGGFFSCKIVGVVEITVFFPKKDESHGEISRSWRLMIHLQGAVGSCWEGHEELEKKSETFLWLCNLEICCLPVFGRQYWQLGLPGLFPEVSVFSWTFSEFG